MYEAFYHLQTKPFRLSPDPRFFFSSRGHRRAVAYPGYGAHEGEGFIVITGEEAGGKTMLAATLAQRLAPKNLVLGQIMSTRLGPDDLVRMVAAAFGLPQHDSKAVLLDRLGQFLLTCSQQGKRALLIVDEAQNLLRCRLRNCGCCRTSFRQADRSCRRSCWGSPNSAEH